MRRHTVPIVITCLAVAFLVLLTYGISNQKANSSIDFLVAEAHYPIAPNASVALPVLGTPKSESLRDFRGRVVVLNVFASWCEPCQSEAPVLERAQRTLTRDGGTIVGITYVDNPPADESFVHQYHLSFPVLRDVNGSYVHAFGTTGVPENFVIDKAGRIVAVERGPVTERWIDANIARALSGPA